jgi:hypothetical protein
MKCSLVHPVITCLRFHRINGYQTLGNRLRFNNPNAAAYRPPLLNQNHGFESTDFKFLNQTGVLVHYNLYKNHI